MNSITAAIMNYFNMRSQGALLISGEWGCGKTYYLNNELIKEFEKSGITPVVVSLFGVSNKKELSTRILSALLEDKVTEKLPVVTDYKKALGTIGGFVRNICSALPKINEYINVDKLFNEEELVFKIIPSGILLCLDDMERRNKKFSIIELFGYIDSLIVKKQMKILFIANEREIEEDREYMEKIIEKTIHFSPDINEVYDSIIKEYDNDKRFFEYLSGNEFIKKNYTHLLGNPELKEKLSNLRTFKFALEHFYHVFKGILQDKEDLNSGDIKNKLEYLWVFILAVSVEYKADQLSNEKRQGIDKFIDIPQIEKDVKLFDRISEGKKDNQQDSDYVLSFVEKYFKPSAILYHFNEQVYNFVVAGVPIDYSSLNKTLDRDFYVENDVKRPANQLLEKFMKDYTEFSDIEMRDNLKSLLSYVEEVQFNDYLSYINASVYLLGFLELYSDDEEDVMDKLKNGVTNFSQREDFKIISQINLEMAKMSIESMKNGAIDKFYSFVMTTIAQKKQEKEKDEVERIKQLFLTDLPEFARQFYSIDGKMPYYDDPILSNIDLTLIRERLKVLQPKDVQALVDLIEVRYEKSPQILSQLADEQSFLNNLKEEIDTKDMKEKLLSNLLINRDLKPRLDAAIKKLSQYSSLDSPSA